MPGATRNPLVMQHFSMALAQHAMVADTDNRETGQPNYKTLKTSCIKELDTKRQGITLTLRQLIMGMGHTSGQHLFLQVDHMVTDHHKVVVTFMADLAGEPEDAARASHLITNNEYPRSPRV